MKSTRGPVQITLNKQMPLLLKLLKFTLQSCW